MKVRARRVARPVERQQWELDFRVKKHGGKRAGAGRKRDKHKVEPAHRARPPHCARHPSHIRLRVRTDVGRLRRGPVLRTLRAAIARAGVTPEFRVIHISIQHNHLHLIIEAKTSRALSEGMRRLTILAANAINQALGRKGKVFAHRYIRTDITTPRQTRNALAYVLNNWRRHREDVNTPGAQNASVDPYSSGVSFDGWKSVGRFRVPPAYEPFAVGEPETWLLRVGWRRWGDVDTREIPGRVH